MVLYREPKLVAVQLLAWTLLAVLAWSRGASLLPRLRFHQWPLPVLWALLAYAALTALWVEVPRNLVYELVQYSCLAALVVALAAWSDHDRSVPNIVQAALVVGLAVVCLVGLLQPFFPPSWLPPTDPASPVLNPSLMGYKNPTAQAILGQVFLVGLLLCRNAGRTRAVTFLLALLLGLELVYLAQLQSRTVYFALTAAAAYLLVLAALHRRRVSRRLAGLALLAAALLTVGIALSPAGRQRAASLLDYVVHPRAYLESDRGTYLLNTLNMVRHNPFGVGLGDWQTHYPVYRLHRRDLFFSPTRQVQRAHSDHVQILGELGWPGLVLWGAFLGSLLLLPSRRYLRCGDLASLLLGAQVAAFIVAMATDYVLELPYNKLQFFLCVFLVLAHCPQPQRTRAGRPVSPRMVRAVAMSATAVALAATAYYGGLLSKVVLAATFHDSYDRALALLRVGEADHARPLLAEVERRGDLYERLPGHVKGAFNDYLALAHSALLRGFHDQAVVYAARALDRHPYQPTTMHLLALILRDSDPRAAAGWRRAGDYVLDEATTGYRIPYPALPPEVSDRNPRSPRPVAH